FTPYCPLQNVAADFPPTLLLHGENDTDVPYEQSVLMAAEFAKHGVEHAFVSIPDGAHGFDWAMDKPLVKDAFQDVLKFLNKHMGAS
ncbi:MAG: prolyl oligopeptidase family serine peptidase, partial [Lentisphaeria bacterium]|nr:S9 family peptidase [Lentisphaeria bacterium]NQZ71077.1 prolyl oligopeptidase family serine peptidase [Lentisphaeria bacterium]